MPRVSPFQYQARVKKSCARSGLSGPAWLAVGVVSAFVMSVVSIKFLMGYIKKNDFTAFGWYRIVVGALVLGVFALQTVGILA